MNDNNDKVIEIPVDREATAEELEELFSQYPDLRRLLGNEYKVRRDKTGGFYVVNDSREVELGVRLFVAISRAYNL